MASLMDDIVETAHNFTVNMGENAGLTLDYSAESLREVDDLLEAFRQEELDEDALLEALGVKSREEITPQRFLDALEPRGITLVQGKEEGLDCIFDFSLDPDVSDELLVIRFDQNREIVDIAHES